MDHVDIFYRNLSVLAIEFLPSPQATESSGYISEIFLFLYIIILNKKLTRMQIFE